MRNLAILCTLAAATLAGTSLAQPEPMRLATTSQCIDAGGHSRPVVCRKPASRLPTQDDICTCRFGQLVTVPYCPTGISPPAENRDFERVRFELSRDGSLVGDEWQGREICVRR